MQDEDGFTAFAVANGRRLRHAARLLTGNDGRAEDLPVRDRAAGRQDPELALELYRDATRWRHVLSGSPPGTINGVPVRPFRTRRPRLLPAALLASALVVATGGGVLVATGGSAKPAADACANGSEYVTVRPVSDSTGWKPGVPAGPTLAGCVNSDRLDKAAAPSPTNPRG